MADDVGQLAENKILSSDRAFEKVLATHFAAAARTNVDLAGQQLQQARDRFTAGVAGNLELTQAQEAAASAADVYISALYTHNLAKASLARAMGVAESAVAAYLGGRK